MYIHLGQETVVKSNDVIGIFDIESTTVSKHTRKFLEQSEKKGEVFTVSYELPKSFIICNKQNTKKNEVFISQISSVTLLKRSEFIDTF